MCEAGAIRGRGGKSVLGPRPKGGDLRRPRNISASGETVPGKDCTWGSLGPRGGMIPTLEHLARSALPGGDCTWSWSQRHATARGETVPGPNETLISQPKKSLVRYSLPLGLHFIAMRDVCYFQSWGETVPGKTVPVHATSLVRKFVNIKPGGDCTWSFT